ncbi:MAG: hypothetical protein AAF927_25955 [Bacteroidota bacterium]
MTYVLNAEGFVMYGDTLVQYTRTKIKYMLSSGIADREVLNRINSPAENILIADFAPATRADGYNWDQGDDGSWTSTGNNRRATYFVEGSSAPVYATLPGCQTLRNVGQATIFHLQMEAQKKAWGNWKVRSSYAPYFHFWGCQWTQEYAYASNSPSCQPTGIYWLTPTTFQSGRYATPINALTYYGVQNQGLPLAPGGTTFNAPTDKFYYDGRNIDTYTFNANCEGGSGYPMDTYTR